MRASTMMTSSVLLIFLQLCSLQMMLVAKPLCRLREHNVLAAHSMLHDMGGPFPLHCRPYNANMSFPDSLMDPKNGRSKCRQVLSVVYSSLKEIGSIYTEHDLPEGEDGVSWDENKVDNFFQVVDGLVGNGTCFPNMNFPRLSSYFSNVTAAIEQQDTAACGWLVLRRDLLWILKAALQKHHTCFS